MTYIIYDPFSLTHTFCMFFSVVFSSVWLRWLMSREDRKHRNECLALKLTRAINDIIQKWNRRSKKRIFISLHIVFLFMALLTQALKVLVKEIFILLR